MCALYGVTRGGFYAWLRRQPSERSQRDAQLVEQVRQVHERSRGYYGSPRVTGQLRRDGLAVGRRRVARLMRLAGLQGRSARLYRRSKVGQRAFFASVPRLQLSEPSGPNQLWVGDVTYSNAAYSTPRSLWNTSPGCGLRLRAAWRSAARVSAASRRWLRLQPAIRLE
ncbi:IS3 family transposase [Piscinibacter terrae]|uniref:HTH-like domain-containing protein n=1 Tax=Piscinibacter terrae TaxID=2496871 RepID=A0A3N7HJN2_9BURK|nr:IS3 family transposase [Albitalea terrae]RQP21166.1 hypothetical protein DZC73_29340 [Albitalea terrae]